MTIHNGFAGLATNSDNILYGRAPDFGPSPAPALVGGVDDSPDTISGLGGNDIIIGDLFNQTNGYEADTINGDEGDDWLFGDTVDFSYAPLIAVFGSLADIIVNLEDGTALNITDDADWLTRVLTGANDDLHGGAGNDHLFGSGGNDILRGDADNDYLDGGTGQDDMNGGTGNDTYIVDNLNDIVSELSGNGVDIVYTTVSYSLVKSVPSNTFLVENITAQGSSAIDLTGNALANVLNGAANSAANRLTGLGGNDTYVLGLGDTVSETGGTASGIDRVQSDVRSLSLSSFASVEQGHSDRQRRFQPHRQYSRQYSGRQFRQQHHQWRSWQGYPDRRFGARLFRLRQRSERNIKQGHHHGLQCCGRYDPARERRVHKDRRCRSILLVVGPVLQKRIRHQGARSQ